jgi:hypothetical protein
MKRKRRTGASETFSVSVDPETKQALRALAEEDFGGNVSALVTHLAEEARRRLAADAYLRRHHMSVPNPAEAERLQAEVTRDIAESKKRRRKRNAA